MQLLDRAASAYAAAGRPAFVRCAKHLLAELQTLVKADESDAAFVVELAELTAAVQAAQEGFDREQPQEKPAKAGRLKGARDTLRGFEEDRASYLAAMLQQRGLGDL